MPSPLISIVSGSYNRLPLLQTMLASARAAFSLPMEFIIVDGGSTDGTQDWCKSQSDLVLIEQSELLGAIRAFDAGALAARGEYVVMANDDITFHPGSLLRAWSYLEGDSGAGAVAFMDNRVVDTRVVLEGNYGVQMIQASPTPVVYAQVGMYRRWLGNVCGWWGSSDPTMRTGRTYGGDNYLSARIWELGYRVEVVKGVAIDDHIHQDSLREQNLAIDLNRPSAYYARYPQGPTIPPAPLIPNRHVPRLRILYCPIYEPGWKVQKEQKRGLREALQRYFHVIEFDYVNHPRERLEADLTHLAWAFKPDVMLLQIHAVDQFTPALLSKMKAQAPGALVVNWCGDEWERSYLAEPMLEIHRLTDLYTGVNVTALGEAARLTGVNVAYWQCAFEPAEDKERTEEVDILFMGRAYSDERKAFGEWLLSLPYKVEIQGSGWSVETIDSTYNFQAGRDAYRRAKVAIGDNQFPESHGFVSNRMFEALAAGGAMYMQQHVPGLAELTGLQNNVHYVEWRNQDYLKEQLKHWLDPKRDKQRRKIAAAGRAIAEERHSFDHRVKELFDHIGALEGEREYAT